MSFGQQLKRLRIDRGYTQKLLGTQIGVSEVTIGNWERGVKMPSLSALKRLGEILQVSLDTLAGFETSAALKGVSPMDARESRLLEQYRLLDRYGKQAVDAVCEIESRRAADVYGEPELPGKVIPFKADGEGARYIALYANPSAAGIAAPLEGEEFEMVLADDTVPPAADFAVRIHGDSMFPYIEDGATVFVSRDTEIANGDVGIFCVDGAMYCKQYYRRPNGDVLLLSANPQRVGSNICLNAECDSAFSACGRVLMKPIPLPDYFER